MTIPAEAFSYGSFEELQPGSLVLSGEVWGLRIRGHQYRDSFEGVLVLSGNGTGNIVRADFTKCFGLRPDYAWRPMIASVHGSERVPRYGSLMFGPDGPRFWGANANDAAVGVYMVDGQFHSPGVAIASEVGVSEWSAEIFKRDDPFRRYTIFDLPRRTASDS